MKNFQPVILFLCFSITKIGVAQRIVVSQNQIWLGYMTTVQLNPKYSLWNDVHYVPSGFFILRTGISREMKVMVLTGGYAYGRLPISTYNTALKRVEHRPWAQAQKSFNLSGQYVATARIRYDARFRQDIVNGELDSSFSFINRIRFMASLKKFLTRGKTGLGKPFIGISNELLLNFGKNVTYNSFDQNRVSIMVGTQLKNIQLQAGYMNRFVKTGIEQFTKNHTLVFWVMHKFRVKKEKWVNEEDPELVRTFMKW